MKYSTQINLNMQKSFVMFIFLFLAENTLFGKIWSKNTKFVLSEIWYLD